MNDTPYKASCAYDPNTYSISSGTLTAESQSQQDGYYPLVADPSSGDYTCYSASCPEPPTQTITANRQSGSITVDQNIPVQIAWRSSGQNCSITNPDGSIATDGCNNQGANQTLQPGTYTWTLNSDYADLPSSASGVPAGCYSGSYNGQARQLFEAKPVSVTVTVTGQVAAQYTLHVQARDLATGNPIAAQVTVDSQPSAAAPFDFTTATAYNGNLPISTQDQTIGGVKYYFRQWTIDTYTRPDAPSTQIYLNSTYSPRTAIAWFSTTPPNPNNGNGNGSGNGTGSQTNWYYCLKNQIGTNACTESVVSPPYQDEPTCEAAVKQWHGATSATPASSYTCFTSNSECTANTACGTTPLPTCTGSSCPSVTLKALPSTINYGQSSELTWTSSNADSCTGTPGSFNVPGSQGYQFDSGTSLNGSARAFPTQTTNYTLTCSNSSGSNSASTSTTVTVRPLGCVGSGCSGTTGPGDVGIISFTVNNKNAVPSLSNQLACIPNHNPNGINNDIISWSVKTSNSCSKYAPTPTSDCNGPETWTLASPTSNPGSCSITASTGWSSGNLSFTNQGSGGFSPTPPQSSTDYTLSCNRSGPYTCTWTRPAYHLTPHRSCDGQGTCSITYTCDRGPNVLYTSPTIPASTEAVSNTLIVMQPPIISNFSPNRVNILIHQPVDLGWNSTPQSSDSALQRVTPNSFCYSGGGSGDTSGWNATADNPFKVDYLDNLLPQKSTIYNLICRSAYAQNNSCYAESNAQTQVNVFSTTPSETNPTSGFTDPFRFLGNILSAFSSNIF